MNISFSSRWGRLTYGRSFETAALIPLWRPDHRSVRLGSRVYQHQISHPDEVVRGEGKGEQPADPCCPTVPGLTHQGDRLQPPEDLLDALALPLTHLVAGMTGHATVDRAEPHLLSNVGSGTPLSQRPHESTRVVTLVAADRDPIG